MEHEKQLKKHLETI